MSKLIWNSSNIIGCHYSGINFCIKATSPIIGNSLDNMSSIYAATIIDEDKISCTIYLVLKTTVKNTVMPNRREVWNDI